MVQKQKKDFGKGNAEKRQWLELDSTVWLCLKCAAKYKKVTKHECIIDGKTNLKRARALMPRRVKSLEKEINNILNKNHYDERNKRREKYYGSWS